MDQAITQPLPNCRALHRVRFVVLSVVAATSLSGSAQSYLTKGEVYDFDVGDVFHHTYWAQVNFMSGPSITQIDTVIAEYWTVGLDSVRYVISSWRYQPPTGMGLPPYLDHDYDTLWVTDLGSPPTHYSLPTPCPPVLDTIGIDLDHCGRTAWVQYVAGDTCWDAHYWQSTFIEGCGGHYIHSYDPWAFTELDHSLRYYRKGTEECGTALSIPVQVWEAERPPTLLLQYDPASSSLLVDLGAVHVGSGDVELMDAAGRSVMKRTVGRGERRIVFNLADAVTGLYLVRFYSNGGSISAGRFVKW